MEEFELLAPCYIIAQNVRFSPDTDELFGMSNCSL